MARTSLLQFKNTTLHQISTSSGGAFTTNYVVNNNIVDSNHGRLAGDLVSFATDGVLPAGLTAGVIYSILEVVSASNFTVTFDGFTELALSSDGTGTHSYEYYDTNLEIENFTVTKDTAEERGFWHESVLTGHREWITKGQHWVIEMKSNLFKESTLSTRRTDFNNLFGYLYESVYVTRYMVGSDSSVVIRDSSSVPVKFIIESFETSFLTQANYEDMVTIRLRSKEYVDMSKTV